MVIGVRGNVATLSDCTIPQDQEITLPDRFRLVRAQYSRQAQMPSRSLPLFVRVGRFLHQRRARHRGQVRSGLSPGGRWIRTFGSPTDPPPDCEVKGAGNSQAATIRVSMRYVTMGCSPGRRPGDRQTGSPLDRRSGLRRVPPAARDCQTRVPVAILALRLPTVVEEAA